MTGAAKRRGPDATRASFSSSFSSFSKKSFSSFASSGARIETALYLEIRRQPRVGERQRARDRRRLGLGRYAYVCRFFV